MKKGNEIKKLKKQLFDRVDFVCEDKELKKKLEDAFLKKLLLEEVEKKPKAKKPKAKKDVFVDQFKPSVDWGY